MTTAPVPLHLAVHVLGLAVAASLAWYAAARRSSAGATWAGLTFGGLLLAASHAVTGALVANDLAWPVFLRAAGYAALAVGSAGGIVGAVVVIAAPPGAYVAAAVAGGAAALASLRGVLGQRR